MKNLYPNNLLFVGRNWSTMGANNTFENLLNFFPKAISVTSKDLGGFDNRIYRYLKNKTGNSCYSSLSVALEINVLKKSILTILILFIIGLVTMIIIMVFYLKNFWF